MNLLKRPLLPWILGAALGVFGIHGASAQVTSVRVARGLSLPLAVTAPVGDAQRIFIVEQTGKILILKNGALLPTPFLDVTHKVGVGFALGLLGLAFHPNYDTNGYFYISYTRASNGASMLERYQVSAGNPDVANPGSSLLLLDPIAQPTPQHNGG